MRAYIILAVLFTMLIGTGIAQNATTGGVNTFKQALEKDGFTVREGGLTYFDFMKLYNARVLPSAYGNNPATKYLVYLVPPAPDHKVTGIIADIIKFIGVKAEVTPFFSLRPDEAVVFVGRTPPECRYFSFDHNLMERTYGNETRWIYANLADTINNLNINTEGTPNGLPGNPYNQTTIVITTADKGIDQRIQAAALSAGYSGDIINTQVLPSAMLNMGVENNSDTFGVFIRPSLFADQKAGDAYIANKPAKVFRITPNESTQLDPYNYPELRVRGTGKTEFDLTADLNELRQAILTKYGKLNATELPTSIWVPTGSDSIQKGVDALGPNNDACYLWTSNWTVNSLTPPFPNLTQYYDLPPHPVITLGNDTNEFIIVYGVNHVATGKAIYENFAPYGADVWNGVGMITDVDFNETAQEYLPDNPNAKYLYVYKIARNCSGDPNCYELPYGPGGYGIALYQPLYIVWRSYLEKATKTGPSYSEIVYDRAIKFEPKK
jgi:hypothetical protein